MRLIGDKMNLYQVHVNAVGWATGIPEETNWFILAENREEAKEKIEKWVKFKYGMGWSSVLIQRQRHEEPGWKGIYKGIYE
jgi:hypothetical protein